MPYRRISYIRQLSRAYSSSFTPKHSEYSTERAKEYLSTFTGGSIRLSQRGGSNVASILIDNVDRKNALTGKMMVDLHNVVQELEDNPALYRVVVLQGKDGNFCSGGDLGFVKQIANSDAGFLMCTFMKDTLSRLGALPIVSVAAVEGFALGGGSELAASCDIRVCQKTARVGFVQGRMGVSPGWGGASAIVSAVGPARAVELLSTAAILDAQSLLAIGFVQHVYDSPADFDGYIKRFEKLDVAAVRAAKRVVAALRPSHSSAFEVERKIFASLWGGPVQAEALKGGRKHK